MDQRETEDMRIVMLEQHDYTPPDDRRRTTRYRAGCGYTVKRDRGEAMVARGVAKEVAPPRRKINPRSMANLGDWDGDKKAGGDAGAKAKGAAAPAADVPHPAPSPEEGGVKEAPSEPRS